nr:isocitrate lyase/phosphoenolpyruvate mutase family protein [Qipengyuania qiaonensis]
MHRSAEPLVLFNIWDAGSAIAVEQAGARAIATGSLSLAGAQGYGDGEDIPFEVLLAIVRRIAASVNAPLTVDFETGFGIDEAALARNATALREAGAIGCNLEDRLLDGAGLRPVAEQARRIATVAAQGLFINARTDVFLAALMTGDNPNRRELVDQAIERAASYSEAGAGCFFAPGLGDLDLIGALCEAVSLPVNIMHLDGMDNAELARCGVARISYGPAPWRQAMAALAEQARAAMQ